MDRGRAFCCNSCAIAMAKLEGKIPREDKQNQAKKRPKPKKKAKKRK